MPELRLEPGSPVSLQRQVYGALRQIVGWGGLERGTPLPSTRRLATVLGVSRNTVLFAHEKLVAEGVIYGRTGSGSRVRQANEAVCLPGPDGVLLHCLPPQSTRS